MAYKEPKFDSAGIKAFYKAMTQDNDNVTKSRAKPSSGPKKASSGAKKTSGGSKPTGGKKSGK